MARLKILEAATAPAKSRELLDGPLKGKNFNIFRIMANSPAVLQTYLGMAGALAQASISEREREIIQLAIGQSNGCDYCVAAHTAIGKKAGLSDDQAIAARTGSDLGEPKLNALASFARAVHTKNGYVSDSDVQAMRSAGYDDAAVAEVVAVYALAIFTNVFNHVADTPVDFPAAPALHSSLVNA